METVSHPGEDLLMHLAEHHHYPSIKRCPFYDLLFSARGLSTHMRGHFKKEAEEPVTCPWCCTEG